jgi:hypothetical protein
MALRSVEVGSDLAPQLGIPILVLYIGDHRRLVGQPFAV